MKLINVPPLLITSCVETSAPFTRLVDKECRIQLTLDAIGKWLKICADIRIVICDGSGVDFAAKIYESFPKAEIEFLSFKNNSKLVSKYGKGFGEGEIINYALKYSKFLRGSDFFAKCTSKLFVKNFLSVLKKWNGTYVFQCNFSGVNFFKNLIGIQTTSEIKFLSVDTRFYIINKKLYLKNFSKAYLRIRDRERIIMEYVFKEVIVENKMQNFMLDFPLKIEGISGTSGKLHKKIGQFRYLRQILHKRIIIKKNHVFNNFFIP